MGVHSSGCGNEDEMKGEKERTISSCFAVVVLNQQRKKEKDDVFSK